MERGRSELAPSRGGTSSTGLPCGSRSYLCQELTIHPLASKTPQPDKKGLKTPVDQETVQFDSGCYVTLRRSSHWQN